MLKDDFANVSVSRNLNSNTQIVISTLISECCYNEESMYVSIIPFKFFGFLFFFFFKPVIIWPMFVSVAREGQKLEYIGISGHYQQCSSPPSLLSFLCCMKCRHVRGAKIIRIITKKDNTRIVCVCPGICLSLN